MNPNQIAGYVQPSVICMAHGQGGAEIADNRSPTLTCNHEAPIVVHGTQDPDIRVDHAHTLGRNNGMENAVAIPIHDQATRFAGKRGDPAPTLTKGDHHAVAVGVPMAVRRLTPTECERLQGFPDGWTLIPVKGKPAADGPRYKALGNSFAVPVVRWIGERIVIALGGKVCG